MKRKSKTAKIKDTPKSVSMMGKSKEPFAKKAKKPEADDKPHMPIGARSSNKNVPSKHAKRLAGVKL